MAELVARTGVSAPTVRYYLSEGLLPPPVRVSANRFLYDERHVEAIRLVRLLRDRRGLPIDKIRALLPDLLPDLLGQPEGGAFRPEVWQQLLAVHTGRPAGPSTAERLLEEAVGAFSAHGYAEVTVDDVCHATGIAKGSFYRHFRSKDELFSTVCLEVASRAIASSEGHLGAEEVAGALASHGPVILDLCSLAAQGRSEFLETLIEVVAQLGRIRDLDTASADGSAILSRALSLVVTRTTRP
jgi:AcrR family transcriptional regulator